MKEPKESKQVKTEFILLKYDQLHKLEQTSSKNDF